MTSICTTVVDISTCPTEYIFFFVIMIHREPEAYSRFEDLPKAIRLTKCSTSCYVTFYQKCGRESWPKEQTKHPKHMEHDTWDKEIPLEHILAQKTRGKCKLNRAPYCVLKQSLDPASFLSTLFVYFILLTNFLKDYLFMVVKFLIYWVVIHLQAIWFCLSQIPPNLFINHIYLFLQQISSPEILLCASIRQWVK